MESLSVVTIAKNEGAYIRTFLQSVDWANELIIIDNGSTDGTVVTARQFKVKIFQNLDENLGKLKQFGLMKARSDWVLLLDVDEIVSQQLADEIQNVLRVHSEFDGFLIPYQNHFLNHPLVCLAQQYSKVRLFRRACGHVQEVAVHEEVVVKGKIGRLNGKIYHYSFRTLPQVLSKFTDYACRESPLLHAQNIHPTWRRIFLYPLHMFWSIFIEGEGYKDGIWGFLLALCFMYYEYIRYLFLWRFYALLK